MKNMRLKRIQLLFFCFTISFVMLSSCAGVSTPPVEQKPSSPAATGESTPAASVDPKRAYEGTTIHALLEGHATSDSMVALKEEFEKETGIRLDLEVIPYNELITKANLLFSQGDTYYDIIFNNYIFRSAYVENDYIYALDDFINNDKINMYVNVDDFIEGYLNAGKENGKIYFLPVYGESNFLMYRKDIFEQYNLSVPTTMDQVLQTAKDIYEKSNGEIYGITMRGEKSMLTTPYATYLWSCGGRWFDETGKCVLDTPEAIKACEMFVEVMKYAPPGYANYGWQENRLAFNQGHAAMTMDATVNGAYNETSDESTVAGKVGYAVIPIQAEESKLYGYPHSLYAHGLYLSKFSKNPEAAFMFMSWATNADFQYKSLQISPDCGATSKTVFESDVFKEKYGAFAQAIVNSVNRGNPDFAPANKEANEVKSLVCAAVSSVLAGQDTAENALKTVTEEINKNVLKIE